MPGDGESLRADKTNYQRMNSLLNTHSVSVSDSVSVSISFSLCVCVVHRVSIAESTGRLIAEADSTLYVMASFVADKTSSAQANNNVFQTLLRVSAARLLVFDFEAVHMLSAKAPHQFVPVSQLSPTLRPPLQLFASFVSEGTLWFDSPTGRWLFVSLFMSERHFQLCVADSSALQSWDCAFVAEVDSRRTDDFNLVYYAAKAHPALLVSGVHSQPPPPPSPPIATPVAATINVSTSSLFSPSPFNMVLSSVANSVKGLDLLFSPRYRDIYSPKFQLVQAAHS
jgi:hypothetical protein